MTQGRMLAMSASGRFVALREGDRIAVVDVQGTSPRRVFMGGGDFAIAGTALVIADPEQLRVEPLEGGKEPATLPIPGARLAPFWGRAATAVMVGDTIVGLEPKLAPAGEVRGALPLHGRAVFDPQRLAIITSGRSAPLGGGAIPAAIDGGTAIDAVPLFGGRSIALVIAQRGGGETVLVVQQGQIVHRVRLGTPRWRAFAPERGLLLIGNGDSTVVTIDLRLGRIASQGAAPHDVAALAIDEEGRSIALVGPDGAASVMRRDALGPIETADEAETDEQIPAPRRASGPSELVLATDSTSEPAPMLVERTFAIPTPTSTLVTPPPAWHVVAPEGAGKGRAGAWEAPPPDPELEIPALLPLALGAPIVRPIATTAAPEGAIPFADATAHLGALLDLVAARAGVAIAEGWHAGRISADAAGHHPFEREVRALAGEHHAHAPAQLAAAHAQLAARAAGLGDRVLASLAANISLPFVELAREYGLSPLALQILVAVIAPQIRGEIARLYHILGNEAQRPPCDDTRIAYLFASSGASREHITDELAPLLRHGLVRRDPASGALGIDPVLVARLRDQRFSSRTLVLRRADRALAELTVADPAAIVRLVRELAEPRAVDAPLRMVVRGRRGSGRHALVAAFAQQLDRPIACIDASQLPLDQLAHELSRAALLRAIPVVSNLELRRTGEQDKDRELERAIHAILQEHVGPVVVRTSPDQISVPLDPGFVEISLAALTETRRAAAWRTALDAASLTADAFALARRYRVGPGTIQRIVVEAAHRVRRAPEDHDAVVDDCARGHLAARIGTTAQRVTRLADWDQVSLPDDMLDSLRELVARARHARTVFDDWGYDDRIATSRGLTALFYGPPGTGKTLVAGLVARELGLELYRVDLAKVMSKWLGETEKHLGELFDAAEDGRIMLLFDEADSLFAKRSEVRSSNDRYANLEVNYLLQRLDAFEGVAILTTNLDGSIDPAFKRRMSMRLLFPFPDEEQRAALWSAHVTSRVPTAGVLDFAALARRFPLSGGYIRNSALRAAFLAAQEGTPLTQRHLERAVLLEYRELGKLANDGRVD